MVVLLLNRLAILYALTYITGIHGILDFTCVVNNPRVNFGRDTEWLIGGYKSGDDTAASVTFGHVFTSGGFEMGLPRGARIRTGSTSSALTLPYTGDRTAIGAFYCAAKKGRVKEKIPAILMASDSTIIPDKISQTVSVGDSVTLSVTTTRSHLRWRHNGNDVIKEWRGQHSIHIRDVQVEDGGIYECNEYHRHRHEPRADGQHAILQLVVRGCGRGKWKLPKCAKDCPVCFNGGVCDERSGECVCAPGFSGINCKTVCGSNRWGQDGQLMCSSANGNDPHSTACRGHLFCLPHPYGCSCAAGYQGIDCDEGCQEGMYGANCQSECHCEGVACLPDTGECVDGQCGAGWCGVNCQESCPVQEPQIVSGLHATLSSTAITIQWDPMSEPDPCSYFILNYDVSSNLEQCDESMSEEHIIRTNRFEISNPQYDSTYNIAVKMKRNGEVNSVVVTTERSEPLKVTGLHATVSSTAISIQWDPISEPDPCYYFILNYDVTSNLENCNESISEEHMLRTNRFVIRNLLYDSTYNISVKIRQNGEVNSIVVTTERMEPQKVTGLLATVSSTVISVEWDPIPEPDPCSFFILNYDVSSNLENCNESMSEEHLIRTNQFEISNPRYDSTYNITVKTRRYGKVNNAIVRTERTEPQKVTGLHATVSSTAISIQWDPISEPDSCSYFILSYDVTSNLEQCEESMSEEHVLSTNQFEIHNPQHYSTYNISVKIRGNGELNGVVVATEQTAPSASPSNITIDDVTSDTLAVHWSEPPCGTRHGEIVSYSFILTNETGSVVRHYKTVYPRITLERLWPLTKYVFKVAAATSAGEGPASDLLSVSTEKTVIILLSPTSHQGGFGVIHWIVVTAVILISLACIPVIVNVISWTTNIYCKRDANPPTPPRIASLNVLSRQIHMSPGGYVKYNRDNHSDSTYQGLNEADGRIKHVYEEIPVFEDSTGVYYSTSIPRYHPVQEDEGYNDDAMYVTSLIEEDNVDNEKKDNGYTSIYE